MQHRTLLREYQPSGPPYRPPGGSGPDHSSGRTARGLRPLDGVRPAGRDATLASWAATSAPAPSPRSPASLRPGPRVTAGTRASRLAITHISDQPQGPL